MLALFPQRAGQLRGDRRRLSLLTGGKRAKKQAGMLGFRLVRTLTIGSMTGIVAATFTFFVANRLLPSGASFAGYERAALEVWAFYLVWLASFAHAW